LKTQIIPFPIPVHPTKPMGFWGLAGRATLGAFPFTARLTASGGALCLPR